MDPILLTIEEAARYVGLGRSNLYVLLQPDGPIPAVNIGVSVRIRRQDLDEWVRSLPPRQPGSARGNHASKAREGRNT